MKPERRISITLGKVKETRILIGDCDITQLVSSVTIEASVGTPNRVAIVVIPELVTVTGLAELTVTREVVVK